MKPLPVSIYLCAAGSSLSNHLCWQSDSTSYMPTRPQLHARFMRVFVCLCSSFSNSQIPSLPPCSHYIRTTTLPLPFPFHTSTWLASRDFCYTSLIPISQGPCTLVYKTKVYLSGPTVVTETKQWYEVRRVPCDSPGRYGSQRLPNKNSIQALIEQMQSVEIQRS